MIYVTDRDDNAYLAMSVRDKRAKARPITEEAAAEILVEVKNGKMEWKEEVKHDYSSESRLKYLTERLKEVVGAKGVGKTVRGIPTPGKLGMNTGDQVISILGCPSMVDGHMRLQYLLFDILLP